MGTRKGRGRGKKDGGDEGQGGRRPEDEEQQGPGNPDADPVRIHEDFIERRLGGGAPATPEAYDRAVRQWRELPGAVRVPSTDLTGADATPGEEAGEEDEEGRGQGRRA